MLKIFPDKQQTAWVARYGQCTQILVLSLCWQDSRKSLCLAVVYQEVVEYLPTDAGWHFFPSDRARLPVSLSFQSNC